MKLIKDEFNSKNKRNDHILQRYDVHNSIRKVADEFGMGKSSIHRIVNPRQLRSDD